VSLFRFADLVIHSGPPLVELPEIAPDEGLRPDIESVLLSAPPAEPASTDWIHDWRSEAGVLSLSLARCKGGFLLRFPDLADFVLSEDARRIGIWPAPETDDEMVRHLLLDQVLPRVMGHRGRLTLHASAVALEGRVLAFVGETGRGKSTLAAGLHKGGSELLTDDGLVVDAGDHHVAALATYTGLRLWPSSIADAADPALRQSQLAHYMDKRRLAPPTRDVPVPRPLAAIHILALPSEGDDPGEIRVERISGRDACIELIRHTFQLDLGDRVRTTRLLAAAGEVAEQVPVFRLTYPRDYALLPAVREALWAKRDQWADSVPDDGQRG